MTRIKNYKKITKLIKKRHLKLALLGLTGFVIVGLLFFGIYSIVFSNKVYARQYIGNINYSGMAKSEVSDVLDKKAKDILNAKIELKYDPESGDGKTYTILPSDINLQFDANKTAEIVWGQGRKNRILQSLGEQLRSIFIRTDHEMVYSINNEALSLKIKAIADELDQPEKDFLINYNDGKFTLSTERAEGKRIDQVEIITNLKSQASDLEILGDVFQSNVFKPQVSKEKADAAVARANKALEKGEILLKTTDQQFKVDVDSIGAFIKSKQDGDDLKVVFNQDRIKSYIDSIAKGVDVESRNAKLAISGGRATVFQAATVGRTLDREDAKISIENLLQARMDTEKSSNVDLVLINLKVATKDPEITEQKINEMGIVELVGTAETNFKGSPSNRVHNIQIGASAINGVLVKPGETFSTIKQLGAIDASGGYLEELVIKENKTIPEFGGGLCQVSSTLFRAALNAGLKIVERQNHKYRVSYYEPPVGMDATIYDPSPDFKFTNNFGSYLLIQSKVVGTKITFEIYGTKDGRIIEMSQPVVTDVAQPEPPLITETETLPPGERKKIDSAHPGATATFHYKVIRGADILQERDFVSKYVPWQEKWLVGKGTPAPAPTPEPALPAVVPEPAPVPVQETPPAVPAQ